MKVQYSSMTTHHPRVCFVCGSACAQFQVHTKAREKGPYFPFLERHDPPAGAAPPTEDGVVEGCRVCFSFLSQQWDSYEQNKTPAMKRLYWLKRTDNGNFTGAEMRLQGEYAAQMMGLQYTPGSYGGGESNPSNYTDYNPPGISMVSPASSCSNYNYPSKVATPPTKQPKPEPREESSALDLSSSSGPVGGLTPKKAPTPTLKDQTPVRRKEPDPNIANLRVRSSSRDREGANNNQNNPSTMICYLCTAVVPHHMGRYVNSKKNVEGEGHFPFLDMVTPPPGAMPMTSQGITRICSNCRTSLNRQWRVFESNKTSEHDRKYKINDEPVSSYMRTSTPNMSIDSQNRRKHSDGATFEVHEFQNACYLCGQVYHKDSMKLLYTRPPQESSKHSMYFYFVAQLKKPVGARPMDNEGRVWSCRACYSYLQRQWQNYHNECVPINERQFQLRPLSGVTKTEPQEYDTRSLPTEHNQQLNVDITSNPGNGSGTSALGLLAIASSNSQPLPVPQPSASAYRSYPQFIGSANATPTTGDQKGQAPVILKVPESERSRLLDALTNGSPLRDQNKAADPTKKAPGIDPKQHGSSGHSSQSNPGVQGIQKQASQDALPVVCYICGYDCHNRMYYLDSCPSKEPASNGEVRPFFPFLTRYEAPKKAEKIQENGKVKSCRYCFVSLTTQWRHYEKTTASAETNRWLWRYIARSYSCYVCGIVARREEARTISLRAYPGLEVHTLLQGEFQMFVGDTAIVCTRCDRTLLAQTEQFERSCVSPRQRNYLDLARALLEEERKAIQQKEAAKAAKASKDGQGTVIKREDADPVRRDDERKSSTEEPTNQGLPPGSKHPPLTMLSPAGSKIARTTATVPPLNATSPTTSMPASAMNATRASSFAAALRKLAKQAGDPPEPGSLSRDGRETSPSASVSSTSPRAPTPQRPTQAVPSLVYANHSSSNAINSPPVVTVAPTATHNPLLNVEANRKSAERASVVQNPSGPMIEPLSIKRESEKMTASLSNHDRQREEERPHSKDSGAPRQHTPHSVITSSASTGRPDESSMRGFQPYRPGDDIRQPLPPHFAAAAATMDPSYPYPSAFMHASPFGHPAFRFDDPYLLERYRLMTQQAFSPYAHPGMLGPPGMHPLLPPGARYPPELLGQHMSLVSPGSKLPDHMSPGNDRPKKEEEMRREREEAERERQREREREAEREKERERERQRQREREEQERRERERQERERHERERMEREREMELERERERQRSLERLRAAEREANHRLHPDDRRSPARPDDPANRYGPLMHGVPHYLADKYRSSAFLPREQQHAVNSLSKQYEEEVRQREAMYQTKERDRQLMHQQVRHTSYTPSTSTAAQPQFLREQDLLIRERERRMELEKREREKSVPSQPMTSPKTSPEDASRHLRPGDPGFHRPFERPMTNGYERNHYSDYERRAMNEAILAQDRHVLQNLPRSAAGNSVHPNHALDSRQYPDQTYPDRGFIEKSHEGIQARLIESEKGPPQPVYNNAQHHPSHPHHTIIHPSQHPQRPTKYDTRTDRPQPSDSEYRSNSHQPRSEVRTNSSAEAASEVPSVEQHFEKAMQNLHNSSNSSNNHNQNQQLRYEAVSPAPCSKLDLEEQKLRESRLNGSYVSEDESDNEDYVLVEERRKERLLLIQNGPPCAMEKSPRKMKFLKNFGLTTKENRSEIDHEMRKKRRKLYRERSVSPVILEDEVERRSSPLRIKNHISQDALNREKEYKFKAYFLYPLGLEAVTPERRRELEIIRQACQREKQRRLKLKPEPEPPAPQPEKVNGHAPTERKPPPALQTAGHKRKRQETDNHIQTHHQPSSTTEPHPIAPSSHSHHKDRHLTPQKPAAALSSSVPLPPPVPENRAVIFPQDSRDTKRRISKEFAQEFHESVLQTTRQQQERHHGQTRSSDDVRYHIEGATPAKVLKEEPRLPHTDGASSSDSHAEGSHRSRASSGSSHSNPPIRWPGIEAIMESYHQHLHEHREEKNVLQEQCGHLKAKNAELNKMAEQLSARMSVLIASKTQVGEERNAYQSAIDGLKRCLKFLR